MVSMPADTDIQDAGDSATLTASRPSAEPIAAADAPVMPPDAARYTAPPAGYLAQWKPPPAPPAIVKVLRPARVRLADLLDHIAASTRRRLRASVGLAVALNIVLLTLVGLYGAVRIWIPESPGDSRIIMLNQQTPALPLPELREAESQPAPPEEPDIVERPKIKPEPEPAPAPDLKAEEPQATPAEDEPEPAPTPRPREPLLRMTQDPVFAPPREAETLIPAPEMPAQTEEPAVSIGEAAPAGEQTPAPTPEPLVEPGAAADAGDAGAEDAGEAEKRRLAEEEAKAEAAREAAAAAEAAAQAAPADPSPAPAATARGDDAFDEAPTRAAIPKIDLPPGAQSGAPGASGVVAIFCPKEFRNKDKAAECAGRTEIRSGWRPGASGEDFSKAVRLLKEQRAQGRTGADPGVTFTPSTARRLDQENATRDAAGRVIGPHTRPTTGFGGLESPAPAAGDNIEAGIDRSQTAPKEFTPPNQRRDRAPLTEAEQRRLREKLRDAEKPDSQ